MTLSEPHPVRPFELTGVKLGDYQFERAATWEEKGLLALVGIGIEPGAADVFARHAADELFSQIDEVGIRDGANPRGRGPRLRADVLHLDNDRRVSQPPVVWERKRGWFTTEPFSEPEIFDFPEGIGPVVAAALPDPAKLGDRMTGKTCAGTLVTGTGVDGRPRRTYLYHVVDNEWSMREYGSQAVVWQTALNPVVALELLASGAWRGRGVLGPEAFPAQPYLDKLAELGAPHGVLELAP